MNYKLIYSKDFQKTFKKLDIHVQKLLVKWIKNNLEHIENPRQFGKPLVGDKRGFWRYRIHDYRLIVEIQDNQLVIIAVTIGHRKEIYKKSL